MRRHNARNLDAFAFGVICGMVLASVIITALLVLFGANFG